MSRPELNDWTMTYHDWDPASESTRESLCVLGNGYLCTRGSLETARAGGPHYPGTYLAGGYNRLTSEVAGKTIESEDLVNWPNWLYTNFRIDGGPWFRIDDVELLEYRVELDVHRALLRRQIRFIDGDGRITTWQSRRFMSMANRHVGAIEWTITPENWSGKLHVRSGLDGMVNNSGVNRYSDLNSQHLEVLGWEPLDDSTIMLSVQTNQSHVQMAQAARTQLFSRGQHLNPERVTRRWLGAIAQDIGVEVSEGIDLRVEKIVAIYTSGDHAISNPQVEASKEIQRAEPLQALLEAHELKWRHLWDSFNVKLKGQPGPQFALRLHTFHLLQTVSVNTIDLDVGVPSRGWHGEAYRGHVLWDELFIFPFLNFRLSELTRSLLMYRYRRLPEARSLAREAGYSGAMYPWQSGSDGREESQKIHLNPATGEWKPDNTQRQRHVNSAIAYNVWQYYQVTRDIDFLSFHGAQMIIEIARFWASIAEYNDDRDRYEIRGIVGPDEFHTKYPDADDLGLNNNAYTNLMASWVLQRAVDVLNILPPERGAEIREDLGISKDTLRRFEQISRKMFIPFHDDGIISQFEGYELLHEIDWDALKEEFGDVQRLDRILPKRKDTPNRYKVSKQADVLMLFYLFSSEELRKMFEHLGYEFSSDMIPRNIDYYLKRTSHGSTLSRMVHAWVLLRSNRKRSWELFRDTLKSDILDIQGGTTGEGIHLGAMAGSLDMVQRCFTGMEVREDALWLNPCLPDELEQLELRVQYRGHWLRLKISHREAEVTFESGIVAPVKVACLGEVRTFGPNDRYVFNLVKEEEECGTAATAETMAAVEL